MQFFFESLQRGDITTHGTNHAGTCAGRLDGRLGVRRTGFPGLAEADRVGVERNAGHMEAEPAGREIGKGNADMGFFGSIRVRIAARSAASANGVVIGHFNADSREVAGTFEGEAVRIPALHGNFFQGQGDPLHIDAQVGVPDLPGLRVFARVKALLRG